MKQLVRLFKGFNQGRQFRIHFYGLASPFAIEPLPQTTFVIVRFNDQFWKVVKEQGINLGGPLKMIRLFGGQKPGQSGIRLFEMLPYADC